MAFELFRRSLLDQSISDGFLKLLQKEMGKRHCSRKCPLFSGHVRNTSLDALEWDGPLKQVSVE